MKRRLLAIVPAALALLYVGASAADAVNGI